MKNTEAVRNHAIENYQSGGWDFIVECFSDEDIQKVLDYDGVEEGDVASAIVAIDLVRKMHLEQQEAARSSVW